MSRSAESFIGQCLASAFLAWGDGKPTPWKVIKLSRRTSGPAGLVVLWATLLDERDVESISVAEYVSAGYDSRATVYRQLADFRALFPNEHGDPNRIARELLAAARSRHSKPALDTMLAI